jgi:hypothetical protein
LYLFSLISIRTNSFCSFLFWPTKRLRRNTNTAFRVFYRSPFSSFIFSPRPRLTVRRNSTRAVESIPFWGFRDEKPGLMIGGFNTQPTSFSHLIHHLRTLRYINPSSSLLSGLHMYMIPCSRSHSFWIDRFLGRLYAPPIEDLSIWRAP